MAMLFKSAVDAALERLRNLQAARAKVHEQTAADEGRLAELRASQSEVELNAILGVNDTGAPALRREIADLQAAIEARRSAVPGLLARYREGLGELGKARSAGIRKEAAKLREKLDQHQKKAAELREALEDHAGAPWAQRTHHPLPPGTVYTAGDLRPVMSRAMVMSGEIAALESEATRIEEQTGYSQQGGRISGESLPELLAACQDVERLAPTPAEIEVWFRQAVARSAVDWRRQMLSYPGKQPPRRTIYSLVWNFEGVIDSAASTVTNSVVSPYETGAADQQHQGFLRDHMLSAGEGFGAWRGSGAREG